MYPEKIEFFTEERVNAFLTKRKEWVTFVSYNGSNRWMIHSWGYLPPSEKELETLIDTILQALKGFVESLKKSTFSPEVYNDAKTHTPYAFPRNVKR